MPTTLELLNRVKARRDDVAARRNALLDTIETRIDRTATEAEEAEVQAFIDELGNIDARLEELKNDELAERRAADIARLFGEAATNVRVGYEPTTYRRGGEHSYFRDLARTRPGSGQEPDAQAAERLQRHRQEMDKLHSADGLETRANMNRTDGTGGEFVPPLWLMAEYLPLARAGRVGADLCRKMNLPGGTDSINIPAVATGTAAAEQSDGVSVQRTDMTTTSKSAAVTTVAGQQVFAMQLLDQSPVNMDEIIFADLIADLATKVDVYVLTKASIGILNVSSINAVTYTDASPTVPELYPKVADAIQQIHTNRILPAQAILMHPRRWAWHLAALDSSNRPLVVPNPQGPTNAFAGMTDVRAEGSVGTLQGLPVYLDPNVPINLGGSTNEDRVIVARWDDLYLWEGAMRTRVLFETDADTLSVRLQVWEYLAFMGSRYPKSIAVISGTGLATPTF